MMRFTTVSKLFCKGTTFCRHSQGNSKLMFAFTAFSDEIENDRTASAISKAVLLVLNESVRSYFTMTFLLHTSSPIIMVQTQSNTPFV